MIFTHYNLTFSGYTNATSGTRKDGTQWHDCDALFTDDRNNPIVFNCYNEDTYWTVTKQLLPGYVYNVNFFLSCREFNGKFYIDAKITKVDPVRIGQKHIHNPSATNTAPANPTPANPTPANPTPANPTPANPTPANPTPANPTPANTSFKDQLMQKAKEKTPTINEINDLPF